MAAEMHENVAGLPLGTTVTLKRSLCHLKSDASTKVWFSLSGDRCSPITLKFDRVGHNHYDGVTAYCFKLPAGEEFWIEFSDEVTPSAQIEILREMMEW
jgi:hypothetical protein